MPHAIDFSDRTVLITGGGAGIGRATAELFGQTGANVVVVEKSEARADEVRASLDELRVPNTTLVADATDPQTATDTAQVIESTYGGLDVLVNNVGDFLRLIGPFESNTDEDIERLYAVNLGHVFTMTRACIPLLRKRAPGSSIITVSSVEGLRAMPNGVVYGAFKAALNGFTQSLAVELGHEGIRVNLIAPETTDSKQVPLDRMIPKGSTRQELAPYWIPQGRFGVPDDHAGAILFLASPLAAWVNGVSLPVDGGSRAAGGWYRAPTGGFTNMPMMALHNEPEA
jgi:NAD(P)-dependent dehydrogenase (short-subunit alcohol dehydrogenase family)